MKSMFRLSALVAFVAMLAVGAAPGLTAQAAAGECYGLSASDCALSDAGIEANVFRKLTSYTMDYDLTVKTSGGPKGSDVDLTVHGSGPFQYTADGIGQLMAGNLNGPLTHLVMQNTITASLTTDSATTAGNFEFRILKNILYFQGDKATSGAWRSVDLTKIGQARTFRPLGGLLGGRGGANPLQLAQAFIAANKLLKTPGLIKATRGADLTIDTQAIAQFTYTIDLPTLFNSPDLLPLLKLAIESRARGATITDAQVKQVSTILAATFKDTTFSITQLVGTTDKLPHGLGIDIGGKVDPSTTGLLAGGGSPNGSNITPIALNVHFLVKLSGIGAPVTVTAPANAQPIDVGPAATAEATAQATMAATAAQ